MDQIYKPKLLDVVIPTCGRAELLDQCLNSLAKNQRLNDFNIVISNNRRSEADVINVRTYQQQGLSVYVFQTKEFLPIDESMLSSLNYAHSKYILWLGDDDQMVIGGVDQILATLENKAPDALVLNMGFTSNPSKEPVPRKNLNESLEYTNPASFFKEWVFDLPFGSFVFLKDEMACQAANRFKGTAHAYSAMLFIFLERIFAERGSIKVIVTQGPISFSVETEKSWSASRSEILLNLIPQWLLTMREVVGESATTACDEYIRKVSKVRYLLDLAKIGGLPKGDYYRSYIKSWKVLVFRMGARFPLLNRVAEKMFARCQSLREALNFQ